MIKRTLLIFFLCFMFASKMSVSALNLNNGICQIGVGEGFVSRNILSVDFQNYKEIDLIKQLEDYNLLIKILYFFNLIFFLVAIIIFLIYVRQRLKGKNVLIEKNEQINFYNKQLQEQNLKLENEIKRRIDESVFELSQRDLVLKKIKDSDQKFSNTFYFNPEIQILLNASSGKVIDVNESFANFFNLSVVDVIDKPIIDLSIGISRFSLVKLINILSLNKHLTNYKIQAKKSFDLEVWLSVSSVKLNIEDEVCYLIVLKDVSSEMKVVEKYELTSNNFNLFSELNNDFIWTASLDFKYDFVSDSVTRLLGYDKEYLLDKPMSYFISFNSYKRLSEKIYQVLKSNNNEVQTNFDIREQIEFIHKNGINIFFDFQARFIKNSAGEIVRLEGVCKDITEIRKLQNLITHKTEFYETIINSLNDIVFWFDQNRNLTYVTPSVFDFIGYSPEELYKINFTDILAPRSIEKIEYLVKFIRGKYENEKRNLTENLDYEIDLISKKGTIKSAHVKSRLFYNTQYNFLGFVATAKDISSEKLMFEVNRQSEMYFKKLFDESPVMMVIVDDENNIIDVNSTFLLNYVDTRFDYKKTKWSKVLLNNNYSEFEVIESSVDVYAKLFISEEKVLDVLVKKADFTNEDQKRLNLYVIRDVTLQTKAEQERSIRENQFIAISENSPDIIIRFDKSMKCIYANYSVFKELNVDNKIIVGNKIQEIYENKEVAKSVLDACLKAVVDDEEILLDYCLEVGDKLKYFKNRIIPEYDMYGKVISILSVSSNVSDYIFSIKSLENNLSENAFLNQVIKICNQALTIEGLLNTLFEAFKQRYLKIEYAVSIYEGENMPSKLIFNSLNEILKHQIINYFSNTENDKLFKQNIKLKYLNQLQIGFERVEFEIYNKIEIVSVLPILSKDNIVGYIFISFNDSIENVNLPSQDVIKSLAHEVGSSINRILAEQKLIESSENYRMLVESTSDLVWKVNSKLEFTFISAKSHVLLGYNADELIKKSIYDIIEINKREQIKQFINLNFASPEMFTFYDLPLIHKKGNIVYVELIAYPLVDENSRFIGYSGINRDITARKINDELKKSKELAEGLTKVKQQFIDNISHEIRTPLNAIIGLTEVLGKYNVNEEQIKYIESIQKNGRSLLGLINNILDVSRIESGKFNLNFEVISSSNFLSDLYFSFLTIANQKQLILEFDIDPYLPDYLIIDEIRLKQVFTNLISNAIKFTDKGLVKLVIKPIILPNHKNKIGLIINVIDTGIGISSNDIDFVFEHFIQSKEQSIKKYGGSGLGLGICKKIVETLKGSISVESKPNVGSNFKIIIPEIEFTLDKKNDEHLLNTLTVFMIGFSDNQINLFKSMFENKLQDIEVLSSPMQLKNISNQELHSAIIFATAKYFYDKTYYKYFEPISHRIIVYENQNIFHEKNGINCVIIENFAKFNIENGLFKILNHNEMPIEDVMVITTELQNEINKDIEDFIQNKSDILWNKLKNSNSMNDISEFSDVISEFAIRSNDKDLINYSNELKIAIKTFDISNLNKLIEYYPNLKTKLLMGS